ncbi:hypothetical protein [Curtobacterium sp. PhB191]|uniref:hypothetical protein n=1 Tax=Curtobacterium sp. PhB191 TaxID=2485202 RepID=UPI00140526E2|nr:hypothetical protein [Curtobacterium sp. PhB191]
MASREEYDVLWERARQRLRVGDLQLDREPVDGDPRWGLSLVLLPPRPLAQRIAGVADELAAAYDGTQHVYGVEDVHLTITSLEPYRDRIDRATLEHYIDVVEDSRGALDHRVRLDGLGGSAAGVFVQGFDDDTLRPIRVRMREAASALHGGAAPPMAFIRNTAHLSISVHREASREAAVVRHVDRSRHQELGEMHGARVALVRYRPCVGSMGIEVLHTVG